MTERDLNVLEHIALYQITIPAVVSRLWFQDRPSEHLLRRLRETGLVDATPFRPGRSAYYTLSTSGWRTLKLRPPRRLGSFALHRALAVLWFCVFGKHRRTRVSPEDLEQYLGEQSTHADVHCWQDEPGPIIFRVLSGQSDDHSLQRLETLVDELRRDPRAGPGLKMGRYGFALLVDREQRVEPLERSIATLRDKQRLDPQTVVIVERVESPETIVEKDRAH